MGLAIKAGAILSTTNTDIPSLLVCNFLLLSFLVLIKAWPYYKFKDFMVMNSNNMNWQKTTAFCFRQKSWFIPVYKKHFKSSLLCFLQKLSLYWWIFYILILMQMITFIKTRIELWYSWCQNSECAKIIVSLQIQKNLHRESSFCILHKYFNFKFF